MLFKMQRKLIAVELGKIGIDWALVFTKDYQLQGTELSPQEGRGGEHGSRASHTSHLIHVCRISSSETQSPPFAHAVFSCKKILTYLKVALCTSIFIQGFQIASWGKSFILLYRIGSRSHQKPRLPCTFPSSILLCREIHV